MTKSVRMTSTQNYLGHFDEIYVLAKEQNKTKLEEYLHTKSFTLNIHCGQWTPLSLLAAENDSAAVNFLLTEFAADKDEAVWGYAKGGHIRKVNELIAKGASKDWALEGYVLGENFHNERAKLKLIQYTTDFDLQKMIINEFITDKSLRDDLLKKNGLTFFRRIFNFFNSTNQLQSSASQQQQEEVNKLRIRES